MFEMLGQAKWRAHEWGGEGEGEGGDNTTQLHLQGWELNFHQGESCSVI